MIRVGEKYVRGSAVNAVTPHASDPDNWSNIVLEDGTWLEVNAPAAVVADRIALAAACADVNCTETHDA